jgi:hypothetical protein
MTILMINCIWSNIRNTPLEPGCTGVTQLHGLVIKALTSEHIPSYFVPVSHIGTGRAVNGAYELMCAYSCQTTAQITIDIFFLFPM